MVAAQQRDIKGHKTTLKYWLKNLPIIRKQGKRSLARGNRLTTELADAKKECKRTRHELVAAQVEMSVLKKEYLQFFNRNKISNEKWHIFSNYF